MHAYLTDRIKKHLKWLYPNYSGLPRLRSIYNHGKYIIRVERRLYKMEKSLTII